MANQIDLSFLTKNWGCLNQYDAPDVYTVKLIKSDQMTYGDPWNVSESALELVKNHAAVWSPSVVFKRVSGRALLQIETENRPEKAEDKDKSRILLCGKFSSLDVWGSTIIDFRIYVVGQPLIDERSNIEDLSIEDCYQIRIEKRPIKYYSEVLSILTESQNERSEHLRNLKGMDEQIAALKKQRVALKARRKTMAWLHNRHIRTYVQSDSLQEGIDRCSKLAQKQRKQMENEKDIDCENRIDSKEE